ncbi:MAG: hypothetical protein COB22_02430 [Cycloclasticus sp.]|nr:MAG: hypothetical protein COB22_02430 [Cycloclasticus sp.]
MKLFKTTAIAGLLVASGAASALELSGNVALTTDYIWRGISQTGADPAIQGGFDADLGNGLYAGVWASNVDFDDDASIEVDVYGGWAGEFNGVGVDVGYIHYHYPSETYQLDEIYVGLSYGPVSFTQYFDLSLDNDDELGDYSDLGLDLGEYNGVALSAHAGYYNVDSNVGGDDYWDYKLAVSTSMFSVDWELAVTGTDENTSDGDAADDTVILTVSKSL